MPRILIALIVLFASSAQVAIAQTAYIDVVITDTLVAPVSLIRYSCIVASNEEWMIDQPPAWAMETSKSSKAQRKMQEDMQRMQDSACKDQSDLLSRLRAQGFRIEVEGEDPYTVEVSQVEACLRTTIVLLSDETELQRLVGYIKGLGNVNGSVLAWETGKPPEDPKAMKSMYTRAREEASRLAALDGQKAGRMLTVEGAGVAPGDFMSYYALALAEMGEGRDGRNKGKTLRSMKFRFELVP